MASKLAVLVFLKLRNLCRANCLALVAGQNCPVDVCDQCCANQGSYNCSYPGGENNRESKHMKTICLDAWDWGMSQCHKKEGLVRSWSKKTDHQKAVQRDLVSNRSGLEHLTKGKYRGLTANYLSYSTETASPNFIPRAREFEESFTLHRFVLIWFSAGKNWNPKICCLAGFQHFSWWVKHSMQAAHPFQNSKDWRLKASHSRMMAVQYILDKPVHNRTSIVFNFNY